MPVKNKRFVADFETTTDPNDCRVWAYGICEIAEPYTFQYGNNIEDFMKWCAGKENYIVAFHNLKFDGAFILGWLNANGYTHILKNEDKADKTYETLINNMGVYYKITVYFSVKGRKVNKVEFIDSMKIFNTSVERIAIDYDLPIRKGSIDYKAKREVGHILTDEELAYLQNDVEIVARALDAFYKMGYKKLTIGSNALENFKDMCKGFNNYFPELDAETDKAIRKSYKGGFTYVNPKNQNKTLKGTLCCLDVNSLYPSRLVNCYMPYQEPIYFEGRYKQDELYPLYTQRLLCTFKVKPDKIPTIQIKGNMRFVANEYLEWSGFEPVELTLTSVDLKLFFEHYDVEVFDYLDGHKFKACKGLFNNYVTYWTEQKTKAKKVGNKSKYSTSKLYMNSIYGKFSTSKTGCQKIPVFDSQGVMHYVLGEEEEMKSVYLPVGTFTTSEGRKLTIETSQKLREWSEKNLGYDAYCYSDTDSIYAHLNRQQVEQFAKEAGVELDPYILGAWDIEQDNITRTKFLRQKCYLKEVNGKKIATVAGCPKELSHLFNFQNFKVGFTTADFTKEEIGKNGKLRFKQVSGGVILQDTDFTIK